MPYIGKYVQFGAVVGTPFGRHDGQHLNPEVTATLSGTKKLEPGQVSTLHGDGFEGEGEGNGMNPIDYMRSISASNERSNDSQTKYKKTKAFIAIKED